MKKMLLMLMIAAMVSAVGMAQESKDKAATDQKAAMDQKDAKKTPDMIAKHAEWEKKIREDLKLTPDQATRIDELNKEYKDKIDVLLQNANLTKDVLKEKKSALKKEKETKLFEILTPEQQATYKDLIEKRKKEMDQNKPAGS